jgi:hypothetical protein
MPVIELNFEMPESRDVESIIKNKLFIQFPHSNISHNYSSPTLRITRMALYVRFLLTETMKTSQSPDDIR